VRQDITLMLTVLLLQPSPEFRHAAWLRIAFLAEE
jgi:hypothetical protein